MKAECKTLKEDYQWQARAQVFGEPFKCDLAITLNLYHGTKRKFDIDNANKLIFDALTGIVYEDDSQIVELTIRKSYDKERPRAELQIFPSVIHSVTV